jgi:hypothetical protein
LVVTPGIVSSPELYWPVIFETGTATYFKVFQTFDNFVAGGEIPNDATNAFGFEPTAAEYHTP